MYILLLTKPATHQSGVGCLFLRPLLAEGPVWDFSPDSPGFERAVCLTPSSVSQLLGREAARLHAPPCEHPVTAMLGMGPSAKTPGNKCAMEFSIFQILERLWCVYSISCNSSSRFGIVSCGQTCLCFCCKRGNVRLKRDKDNI